MEDIENKYLISSLAKSFLCLFFKRFNQSREVKIELEDDCDINFIYKSRNLAKCKILSLLYMSLFFECSKE